MMSIHSVDKMVRRRADAGRRGLTGERGFTLIEVMVAVAIIAVISVVSFQSIDTAGRSTEAVQRQLKKIQRFDRFWRFVEMDLRNVLGYTITTPFGGVFEAMRIESDEDYWLMHLRGGNANPLLFPRSELSRVGYRLEDEIVWRDSWYDPANPDPDIAFKQKLLEDVDEVRAEVLPRGARSLDDNSWLDLWPLPGQGQGAGPAELPLAVRVTVVFNDEREVMRMFSLAPGF